MSFLEVNEQDNWGREPNLERRYSLLDGPKDKDGMIFAFIMDGGHE
jgi:hypothetical protein